MVGWEGRIPEKENNWVKILAKIHVVYGNDVVGPPKWRKSTNQTLEGGRIIVIWESSQQISVAEKGEKLSLQRQVLCEL